VIDLGEMQMELTELFGKPVDLVEKSSLINPFRRKKILQTAEVVYAN
jgi:predicted nucleotidyltransferase